MIGSNIFQSTKTLSPNSCNFNLIFIQVVHKAKGRIWPPQPSVEYSKWLVLPLQVEAKNSKKPPDRTTALRRTALLYPISQESTELW